MIIGIIFSIVFCALLAKAIFETLWGLCIVIHGLFWHAISLALKGLANTIRTYNKIVRIFKRSEPRVSIFNGIKRAHVV
jgi:hypothetical protein